MNFRDAHRTGILSNYAQLICLSNILDWWWCTCIRVPTQGDWHERARRLHESARHTSQRLQNGEVSTTLARCELQSGTKSDQRAESTQYLTLRIRKAWAMLQPQKLPRLHILRYVRAQMSLCVYVVCSKGYITYFTCVRWLLKKIKSTTRSTRSNILGRYIEEVCSSAVYIR